MTDIVEQAARVAYETYHKAGEFRPYEIAQALADAGLLKGSADNPKKVAPSTQHRDVYELAAERIGTESTWTVDAREALGLTRTVPTRDEIARITHQQTCERCEEPQERYDYRPSDLHAADAVLALMADQPTVEEAKAEAWEEALSEAAEQGTIQIPDNPYREEK